MQQIKGGRFFFEYTQYVQFNFIVLQLPYTIRHWPNSGNTSKYHTINVTIDKLLSEKCVLTLHSAIMVVPEHVTCSK